MNRLDPHSSDPDASRGSTTKRWLSSEDRIALVLISLTVLLIIGSRWISPGLGSWSQAQAILVISTFVMVVAFGQQTVILTGGLDLSVPSVMTCRVVSSPPTRISRLSWRISSSESFSPSISE